MSDNREDAQFDGILQQAVKDKFEQELEEALADAGWSEAEVGSAAHMARMQALWEEKPHKSRLYVLIKYYSRVAAILFLVVLIGGAALLASPSLRGAAADFLASSSAEAESAAVHSPNPSIEPVDTSTLYPSEIPEGYMLISCSVSENWTTYLYQNEQNQVLEVELFSPQRPVDSSTAFGEGIMISQVFEVGNGSDVAECGRIQVQAEGYTVVVTGWLSEEELQTVCNSISEK